ncbi:MAG: family 43 glycosylhydrolase [Christensenellaceae bacterium]
MFRRNGPRANTESEILSSCGITKYYLYPLPPTCDGIKVFESEDLIHWTYKGLAVAETEDFHGAYAPEVIYYNGWFYMCQSRGGKGHYIYRPKVRRKALAAQQSDNGDPGDTDYGNLGMGIDGSFYVSDEGKLYLLHTSTPAGLKYNEITDSENISPSTLGKTGVLGDANLRHWIEGPGIFRRGDYSYLTYTGNHVISKGYRVAYSYAENLTDLSGFIQSVENVTLINTNDEHYGLGHSSNVVGSRPRFRVRRITVW